MNDLPQLDQVRAALEDGEWAHALNLLAASPMADTVEGLELRALSA